MVWLFRNVQVIVLNYLGQSVEGTPYANGIICIRAQEESHNYQCVPLDRIGCPHLRAQ